MDNGHHCGRPPANCHGHLCSNNCWSHNHTLVQQKYDKACEMVRINLPLVSGTCGWLADQTPMDITVQIPQKMKIRPNTQLLLSSSDISEKNPIKPQIPLFHYSTISSPDSCYWVLGSQGQPLNRGEEMQYYQSREY